MSPEPINDLWAQQLRRRLSDISALSLSIHSGGLDRIQLALDEAREISLRISSDSPIKMAIRTLDDVKIYDSQYWSDIEPFLQRCLRAHPHVIDYVYLLLLKRFAIGKDYDRETWMLAIEAMLKRSISLNHHHEICWCLWIMLTLEFDFSSDFVAQCLAVRNDHVRSLIVQAYADELISRKPKFGFGSKLSSDKSDWLSGLIAKSFEVTGATFKGCLSAEFEHLASKNIRLIDFKGPVKTARPGNSSAISRTRYGYDDDDDDEVNWDDVPDDWPEDLI